MPSYAILFSVAFFVVYFMLICFENLRRNHPTNLILTAILTLAIGFMTMMVCARYEAQFVMLALTITSLCCSGVALLASTTSIDFTRYEFKRLLVFCFLDGLAGCGFWRSVLSYLDFQRYLFGYRPAMLDSILFIAA